MQSTLVSTILNRMNRFKDINSEEEQFKIRDLDSSLRESRRTIKYPWTLQQGSLKVFQDVLIYPVPSDYDDIGYLDTDKDVSYRNRARFKFTSLREFFENPDNRNDLSEIHDSGTAMLGVRYDDNNGGSIQLDGGEDVSKYTATGDASDPVKDTVTFKKGSASIKITITNSSGVASVKDLFTQSISDTNYKQKFHFKWIFLASTPTNIEMRFQTDDNNYLTTTVTTQFSGQAFKANQWNLIAHNLDEATETGTFDSTSIVSEKMVLTGASTGTYYFDESNLRQWTLMDFWYYSKFNVKTVSASVADQEFIMNTSEVYSTDSSIIGDLEWIDVVMYDAMLLTLNNSENDKIWTKILRRRDLAWDALMDKYPDLTPLQIETKYRFRTDFTSPANYSDGHNHNHNC